MSGKSEAEKVEFGRRRLEGGVAYVIPILAASWSLFQLAVADLILLKSVYVRCIHLAFAIGLVFLSFTASKRSSGRMNGMDWVLAGAAMCSALYLALDFEGISDRQGLPLFRDVLAGVGLIALLLEAARRALGPALPVIAGLFILSSLFASDLPGFLAYRDVSLRHLVSKLTLSTEGIFGIPLRVSSDTVFLFVLFGAMLERVGGGEYFVDLAYCLLGRYRGGPAKAAVLASGLTGSVSGSSIANTVTTGTFTIPLMKRYGYPAEKAAAVEVAASTNGQLMPPIMGAAAFIIAEYCNVPYLEVVRAALVPALLSYITLLFITHLEAVKLGLKGVPTQGLPTLLPTLLGGLHFTVPFLFLLYELIIRRRSANIAAYYAILALISVVFARNLFVKGLSKKTFVDTGRQIWESLVAGGRNMMSIGVAVAAAGIIVGVVSMGLGGKITTIIDVLSGGKIIPLLLVTAVVSLVLGMGLPTTANYIVMANLTAPAIVALAGDAGWSVPLLAAHLFCFYFGILADDTPPVGLAAYAGAAIAGSDPIRTGIQGFVYDLRTAVLPFVFIMNTKFLLIGVSGWWSCLGVFGIGLLAMALFTVFVQGHLHRPLSWVERLTALAVSLALFRFDWWI